VVLYQLNQDVEFDAARKLSSAIQAGHKNDFGGEAEVPCD
jgi:hypothetical protein